MQELQHLGRGGFGLVVGAVNRLDGRMYAIKKILMSRQSSSSYARILREVTTLSRLQHPHVVRYFQASLFSSYGFYFFSFFPSFVSLKLFSLLVTHIVLRCHRCAHLFQRLPKLCYPFTGKTH